ncbi:Yps3p [Sugiyamaella lignohabitans]|uniref:Yps3p n=1 Tax=Sugiyamaella lignohabitans TaxID=796027 RepID=A0A167FDB7_9ASCO|nr:Yps3p [Sugiyamaella lignohabitans]ANB15153.1 Yps3p [Sugiyamaella lignohabitans]
MKFCSSAILSLLIATSVAAPSTKDYLYVKTKLKSVPKEDRLSKRAGYYDTPLANQIFQYVATFDLGTPAQTVEAMIDTGSSDLWVYTKSSGQNSSYSSADSSTYKLLNHDFEIQYVSGRASGDWAQDTLKIDGASITNQQFGTVSTGSESPAVFGIGLMTGESASTRYKNVPQSLVDQGYIARNVFSLYLDDLDVSEGGLLFGAVDSEKYIGQLYTVPITDNASFKVTLSSISSNGATLESSAIGGILDSGTSLTYLPRDTVSSIANHLGATYDYSEEAYFLDKIPSKSITYNFSGAAITVQGSELAIPASDFNLTGGSKPYVLSIFPNTQSSGYNLLGDSFLRSAYVVYDLDNNQISIAQSSWNSDSSDIKVISDTVPGAVAAPSGSSG